MRNFRVWIKFFDSDEAFIGFDLSVFVNLQIAFFQDSEIVPRASGTSDRQNQSGEKADEQ
jgi:hypothetical protein